MSEYNVGFPQHYAAASLKPFIPLGDFANASVFSAALRCGLIEAREVINERVAHAHVFRSITLRPH